MNNIIIFPKETKQNDFFDENGNVRNGECVLSPTVCTCTRELNGCFELYIELTNPSDNIIKHISCWNYIAAPVQGRWDESGKITRKNQIFFIIRIEKNCDQNGTIVYKIYTKHIFYILANQCLNSYEWNNSAFGKEKQSCYDLLVRLTRNSFFSFYVGSSGSSKRMFALSSNVNNVGAIMDSDGVLEKFGVELHRDNFYFSARLRKEFSKGDSTAPEFRLLHGKEINSISETVDYTNTATSAFFLNSDGHTPCFFYTHHKKIGMMYPVERYFSIGDAEQVEQVAEGTKSYHEINHPELSCTISLNAIKQSSEYSEFTDILNCDIGDLGLVYSSSLHINVLQKVSRIVEDVLTGQYTEIILGNIPGSISKIRNSTNFIGSQTYINDGDNGGGFTAEVKVSNGKNVIDVAAAALLDTSDLDCDAIVDFGDMYVEVMSDHPNQSLRHCYAYDGTYTLKYTDCFDDPGIVMGMAIKDAGAYDTAAIVDNIVFLNGTKKIGQYYKISEYRHTEETLGVLKNCRSITKITIPSSVEYISPKCFPFCLNLKEIYFDGTISKWKSILNYSFNHEHLDPKEGWIDMYNVTVHCTDGDTIQPGRQGVNPLYGV